jgi:hypothetical protein
MPLYTYVVTFNDSTYVGQGSHSNFRGFVNAWCSEMPVNALKGFDQGPKKQLSQKAYSGTFDPVANRKNVWHKEINLNGKIFNIHAIETRS